MTRAGAPRVAMALRRLDALAPLERWAPRVVAPAPRSEVGATADGFGAPVIPWDAIAPGDDDPTATAGDDRSSPHRSRAVPTPRPAPVGRGPSHSPDGRAGLDAPARTSRAWGSDTMTPATVPDRSPAARERSVGGESSAQGHSEADPAAGDTGRATVGSPRRPIGPSRPVGIDSLPDRPPTRRGTPSTDVADPGRLTARPYDVASDGAHDGTRAVRPTRRSSSARADTTVPRGPGGDPHDIDRHRDDRHRDDRYHDDRHHDDRYRDVELPGGALGELVRRWDGPPSPPNDDDPGADDPLAIDRARHGPRRQVEPRDASSRRVGRSPHTDEATAGDEHLLDVLDLALTELIRRDAERHGLEGLLP